VAHALGAAALAAHGLAPSPVTPHAAATGTRAGDVPRRVSALLRPTNAVRWRYLAVIPIALAVASIVWTGEAIYDLGELLYAAR
jgi:hypothetical protein